MLQTLVPWSLNFLSPDPSFPSSLVIEDSALSTACRHLSFRSRSLFSETSFSSDLLIFLSAGSFALTLKPFQVSNMFKIKRSPKICPSAPAHFIITLLSPLQSKFLEQVLYIHCFLFVTFHTLFDLSQPGLVHP